MKTCCKCKLAKPLVEFGLNRSSKSKDGVHPECRLCVKGRKAKYYLQNKPRLNTVSKKYKKIRRASDIGTRLRDSLRARLNCAIKNSQKSGSAIADLGCSIDYLKSYLEERFKTGMSWDNYGRNKGQWSIDHILPLSKFALSDKEQLLVACNFTNLQPLWVEENLEKSNK